MTPRRLVAWLGLAGYAMLALSLHLAALATLTAHPGWACWCLLWAAFWHGWLRAGARDPDGGAVT